MEVSVKILSFNNAKKTQNAMGFLLSNLTVECSASAVIKIQLTH